VIEEPSTVGERVGGDVHHAHHQRNHNDEVYGAVKSAPAGDQKGTPPTFTGR
jgi:hypothetical protein